jgi:type I restriction enzyme, S subunit
MPSNIDKHSVEGEQPVRLCNYVDVYRNDRIREDMEFMAATATDAQIDRFTLRAEDVLATKDSEEPSDIGVAAYVPHDMPGVVCGYHLAVFRPTREKFYGGFLAWALRSRAVQAYYETAATGISRYALSVNDMGMTPIPFPDYSEQQRIASFLDEQTARIDALIAQKERLSRSLDELRLSKLEAEMAGALAAGSQQLRRVLLSLSQGWSPVAESFPAAPDAWGVLKLSAIKNGSFVPSENKQVSDGTEVPEELRVRKGDVLVTRANTPQLVGSVALVFDDLHRLFPSDLIYTLRVDPSKFDAAFLVLYLQSPQARAVIEVDARGSSQSMVKLSQEHIRSWRIPQLPLRRQAEFVKRLQQEFSAISGLKWHVHEHIERLQEYRSSLISAAVTGQIDLSGHASKMPHEHLEGAVA